jgi:hypothetical protein
MFVQDKLSFADNTPQVACLHFSGQVLFVGTLESSHVS